MDAGSIPAASIRLDSYRAGAQYFARSWQGSTAMDGANWRSFDPWPAPSMLLLAPSPLPALIREPVEDDVHVAELRGGSGIGGGSSVNELFPVG